MVCCRFVAIRIEHLAYSIHSAIEVRLSDGKVYSAKIVGTNLQLTDGGVTEAASGLKRRKLIAYARGQLQILNVPGLKRASCSCYQAVNAVFARAQRQ